MQPKGTGVVIPHTYDIYICDVIALTAIDRINAFPLESNYITENCANDVVVAIPRLDYVTNAFAAQVNLIICVGALEGTPNAIREGIRKAIGSIAAH